MFDKLAFGYKAAHLLTKLYERFKKEFGTTGPVIFYALVFVAFTIAIKAAGVTTTVAWHVLSVFWPVVLVAVVLFFWYLHETDACANNNRAKDADTGVKKDNCHKRKGDGHD